MLIHFSAVAATRAAADPRALADRADRGARADPRDPARLRADAEADRRRGRLLLPDRRQRGRRAALDRRRARADDAHARRRTGSRSSAASSCPARCRRSSPARASPRPTPRSAPSSASGPARRPGLGFVMLQSQPRSTRRASSPPSSSSRALALALYALVTLAERLLVPWHREAAPCLVSRHRALAALAALRRACCRRMGRRTARDADARLDAEPGSRRLLLRARRAASSRRPGSTSRSMRPPTRPRRSSSSRSARATSPSPTSRRSSSPPRRSCRSSPSPRSCRSRSTRSWRSSRRCSVVADLRGRTVGITGVPSDYASLDTALASAGLHAQGREGRHRRLQPAPGAARPPGRRRPRRLPQRRRDRARTARPAADDHPARPRRRPLLRRARPRREHARASRPTPATARPSAIRHGVPRRHASARAGTPIARSRSSSKVTASDPAFLARATPATLALLAGPDGVGCMRARRVAALRRLDARARAAEDSGSRLPRVVDTASCRQRCSARPHTPAARRARARCGPPRREDVRETAARARLERLAPAADRRAHQ